MIHADMVPENVLVDGNHVRLIDFDDAGYGWHLFEMATSLYFSHSESYFDQLVKPYIEGYRSERALSDDDLSAIPTAFSEMARATTYLGWVHTRTRKKLKQPRSLTPMLVEMACTMAEKHIVKG